jgi:LacI family transcriptional regulator
MSVKTKKTRITIKDVALEAAVGVSTVSMILNNHSETYNAKTVRRVKDAALKLDYAPNFGARAIKLNRFQAIGLIISDTESRSYTPEGVLQGIMKGLKRHHHRLNVIMVSDEELQKPDLVKQITSEGFIDGLICNYSSPEMPAVWHDIVSSFHVPTVYFNNNRFSPSVRPDDYQVGYDGVCHLYGLGHRRIAFYAHVSGHYSRAERCRGWREACRELKLTGADDCPEDGLEICDETGLGIIRELPEYLRPTALIASGITEYHALQGFLQENGWLIPEKISVLCVLPGGDMGVKMGISGFSPDWRLLGETAAEKIMSLINSPEENRGDTIIPYTFVDGKTVADLNS